MMSMGRLFCVFVVALTVGVPRATAQGIFFPSAGAVHRSMAGASTAAPLDAAGATYWNPASICALTRNEVFVGADLVSADTLLVGSVQATGRSGSSLSEGGLAAAPAIGLVGRHSESTFSYGIGVYSLVGRNIDFPGSTTHPVLTPYDPPNSTGVGPVASSMSGLQIAPMIAKKLTKSLAVGGGATVTSLTLALDPAVFVPRNPNGTFAPATLARPYWGAGFQLGLYYSANPRWSFGASYKSPQWFETFGYNSKDEKGNARSLQLNVSLPSVVSVGIAYRGFERTLIAVDARYFNYGATSLFGDLPAQGGLGWANIWSVAVGARRQLSETVAVQFGYLYSQNPIPEAATLANIQLPAINKTSFSGGVTVRMTDSVDLTGAVVYALSHTNRGTLLQIPGSSIELKQDLATFSLGFSFRL